MVKWRPYSVQATIIKNVFLALLLSMSLTLAVAILYTFYPLIVMLLGSFLRSIVSSGAESNGISAVVGGASESFFSGLVLIASILFLVIFFLLHKRSMKN